MSTALLGPVVQQNGPHSQQRHLDRQGSSIDLCRSGLTSERLALPAVRLTRGMDRRWDDRLRARRAQLNRHRAVRHLVAPRGRDLTRRQVPAVAPGPPHAPALHRTRRQEVVPQPQRLGVVEVHIHQTSRRLPEQQPEVGRSLVDPLAERRTNRFLAVPPQVRPPRAVRALLARKDRHGLVTVLHCRYCDLDATVSSEGHLFSFFS